MSGRARVGAGEVAVAAAVLAGGRSRRMGHDKATIEIRGRRMIDRVLAAVVATGCDPVRVIGGDPTEIASVSVPIVPDRHPGEGPLGALLTAFHELPDATAVLMVPCDVPFLSPRALDPLVERWAGEGSGGNVDVVVARTDRLEPMCAVWSRLARPRLVQAFDDGERSLRSVLGLLDRIEVPVDLVLLRNVNTPEDLHEARRATPSG